MDYVSFLNNYRWRHDGVYVRFDKQYFLHKCISSADENHPPLFYEYMKRTLRYANLKKNMLVYGKDGEPYQFRLRVMRINRDYYFVSFRPNHFVPDPEGLDALVHYKHKIILDGLWTPYNNDTGPITPRVDDALDRARSEVERGMNHVDYHQILYADDDPTFQNWTMRIVRMPEIKGAGKWYLVSFHPAYLEPARPIEVAPVETALLSLGLEEIVED
jgi:hypothetical protein